MARRRTAIAAMARGRHLWCGAVLALAAGCASESKPAADDGRIGVYVTIPPQADFVERVGGARVRVEVLVGPGQSSHHFEPLPQQVAGLARARLFFRIGVPFENGLIDKVRTTAPNLEVVDTREGVPLRAMQEHDHDVAIGEPDPHIWLSPRRVKIQAATMARALARVDPAHAAEYDANLRKFQAELDTLDAGIAAALGPLKGREFLVFHPAFGYFADDYGLKQAAIEVEGKEPSARQTVELIEWARRAGIRVIFFQPQFAMHNAERIAEAIGGVAVPMDPQAKDYLANLASMAKALSSLPGGTTTARAAEASP